MIVVDTNILVYAHREDSKWHASALSCVKELAQAADPWAIPWSCMHEFVAIVTHPRIYMPPTPLKQTLEQVEAWLESPSLHLLSEFEGYWDTLKDLLQASKVQGAQVHDARIAALVKHHSGSELWTADRDFTRFPGIKTRNPLVMTREKMFRSSDEVS